MMKKLTLLLPLILLSSCVSSSGRGEVKQRYLNCHYGCNETRDCYLVYTDYDLSTKEYSGLHYIDIDDVRIMPRYSVEIYNELIIYTHAKLFNIYIRTE